MFYNHTQSIHCNSHAYADVDLLILTGIRMKVPLFIVGYDSKGTTGTEPFFMKIGP